MWYSHWLLFYILVLEEVMLDDGNKICSDEKNTSSFIWQSQNFVGDRKKQTKIWLKKHPCQWAGDFTFGYKSLCCS